VRGHLLGNLEPAAALEVGSHTGGAEGVTADLGLDPGRQRAASEQYARRLHGVSTLYYALLQ
jgi:hypothetical protein